MPTLHNINIYNCWRPVWGGGGGTACVAALEILKEAQLRSNFVILIDGTLEKHICTLQVHLLGINHLMGPVCSELLHTLCHWISAPSTVQIQLHIYSFSVVSAAAWSLSNGELPNICQLVPWRQCLACSHSHYHDYMETDPAIKCWGKGLHNGDAARHWYLITVCCLQVACEWTASSIPICQWMATHLQVASYTCLWVDGYPFASGLVATPVHGCPFIYNWFSCSTLHLVQHSHIASKEPSGLAPLDYCISSIDLFPPVNETGRMSFSRVSMVPSGKYSAMILYTALASAPPPPKQGYT